MVVSKFRGKKSILILGLLCLIAHARSAPMTMLEPKTEEEIIKTWNTYCPEDKAAAMKEMAEKTGMAMIGNFEGGGMEIWCRDNDPNQKKTKVNLNIIPQAVVDKPVEVSPGEKKTTKTK